MKKYELLVDDTITFFGVQLFRIKALISFSGVEKGEVGGYVASESNLSQYGDAWVYGDARVYGNADYIVFKTHGLVVVISLIQNRTKTGELVVFMVAVLNWLKKHIKIAKNPVIFIKRMSILSKS